MTLYLRLGRIGKYYAMIIVLDTCSYIWNSSERNLLSPAARDAINEANKVGELIYSDITLWEIALLKNKNRLRIEFDLQIYFEVTLAMYNYRKQEITPEIAECGATLPPEINHDPADRIIAATSIVLQAPLITADKNLRKSKLIKTIW